VQAVNFVDHVSMKSDASGVKTLKLHPDVNLTPLPHVLRLPLAPPSVFNLETVPCVTNSPDVAGVTVTVVTVLTYKELATSLLTDAVLLLSTNPLIASLLMVVPLLVVCSW